MRPDMEMVKKSLVTSIRSHFSDYCRNIIKSFHLVAVGDNGEIIYVDGYRECMDKAEKAMEKVNELEIKLKEVNTNAQS